MRILFYTNNTTSRIRYACDFIGKELAGEPLSVTSDPDELTKYNGPKINYSNQRLTEEECWLQPHSLLFESTIQPQTIDCFEINSYKAFFRTEGDLPFDIFAASFYLLSRYEEYLPHTKDMYGRYAFENSLAYKQGFLNIPLVNTWLNDLKKLINQKFSGSPPPTPHSPFTFLPTYDIDMAWSYKYKGWWRNAGGLLRSFFKGEWSLVKERIQVLRGRQRDPFDAFGWMNQLHEKHKLKPYYFFLVPERRGKYDKNILPSCKAMQALIQDQVIRYPIGIHPSWASGDDVSLLKKEIDTLSKLSGSPVVSSRQHYIRFTLPEGYRRLLDSGIQFDFSMGYGSINGFRASVASPFYWYDLEKEEQTKLMLFPFCYMDANSFYEQKLTAVQALEEMRHYYHAVRSVNGYFIMIWHNPFLGTGRTYKGWREVYEQFIKENSINMAAS
ncbi:MAG: polysaccharide deacetylase family protein [Chitinophagaceae bacterium]|nr:polysaccharide deacetylase family protein [Chitinophagaceae bacterium]